MPETPSISTTNPIADDEISLLDLLVVVAENLKLLIIGPIVAGLVALGVAFSLTPTYESTALLSADKSVNTSAGNVVVVNAAVVASLATSATVLEAVGKQTPATQGLSAAEGRRLLQTMVKTQVGKQDRLLTLTAQGKTPQEAQALATLVLQQIYQATQPRGAQRTLLETQLQNETASLAQASDVEKTLAQQVAQGNAASGNADAYARLMESNSARLQTIARLQAQLQGLSADDLVQAPTLPEKPIKPKKSMIAVIAALATGFFLLLFVFVRNSWQQAATSGESADKMLRVRRALGLKA